MNTSLFSFSISSFFQFDDLYKIVGRFIQFFAVLSKDLSVRLCNKNKKRVSKEIIIRKLLEYSYDFCCWLVGWLVVLGLTAL